MFLISRLLFWGFFFAFYSYENYESPSLASLSGLAVRLTSLLGGGLKFSFVWWKLYGKPTHVSSVSLLPQQDRG